MMMTLGKKKTHNEANALCLLLSSVQMFWKGER